MTNWDDLAEKFKTDAQQERTKQELTLSKQNTIAAGARPLWLDLVSELERGAKAMESRAPGLISVGGDLVASPNNISITYHRADKDRELELVYQKQGHKVSAVSKWRTGARSEASIVPNKADELSFKLGDSLLTAEQFAERLFSWLLGS